MITNPRSLCNLFKKETSQRKSAMKKTTEVGKLHVPGAWPEQPAFVSSPVKLPKKKSVSFSTASKESHTVRVPRWINVTRDEWAATSVVAH